MLIRDYELTCRRTESTKSPQSQQWELPGAWKDANTALHVPSWLVDLWWRQLKSQRCHIKGKNWSLCTRSSVQRSWTVSARSIQQRVKFKQQREKMVDMKLWLWYMRAVLVVRNHWVLKSRMNIICSNIITSTSCTAYPPCFILIPEVMEMRRRSSSAFQSFLRRTSGFTGVSEFAHPETKPHLAGGWPLPSCLTLCFTSCESHSSYQSLHLSKHEIFVT